MRDLKSVAADAIRAQASDLLALSHAIHAHPELAFEEVEAARRVATTLRTHDFAVDEGICELPTALHAVFGDGNLHVGLCAEYDALPGIGHACGHNIIAASSVGAAFGLAVVARALDLRVSVFGTPAEEEGGGKVLMLERGAFADVDFAMMVHPAPFDVARPRLIAASTFDVHYTGRAAHASAYPELGINAADAVTVAQTAIGLLRQHLEPDHRVHGIVTHGGDAPNIVPARATARYTIRAHSLERLDDLRTRVDRCFEAGALATGTTLRFERPSRPYAEVVYDADLTAAYAANAQSLGRVFVDGAPGTERAAASTDMGNVSRALPSIHPLIGIESSPAVNHQPEFTRHCITAAADRAVIDGAIALAWTAIDAASSMASRARLGAARAGR